jgi:RHS repeat-associated protein
MNMIAEYDGSNTLQRRTVHGAGVDEPLVEYDAAGTRRFLHQDERGSVIARSDSSGTVTNVNRYDEYGVPQSSNTGRFQYTGQAWLPEIGLQYSRARMYNPTLPRFMQPDAIGYGDGMNMYAYVSGDPVNRRDPTGTQDNQHVIAWGFRVVGFGGGDGGATGAGNSAIVCTDFYVEEHQVCSGGGEGQDDSQVCRVGGGTELRISRSGGTTTIIITGSISFSGAGADPATRTALVEAMSSRWSGFFGPMNRGYHVVTSLIEGRGGILANVSAATSGTAYANAIGGGRLSLFTLPVDLDPVNVLGAAAHEFGHSLGAMDRYDYTRDRTRWFGFENNIMSGALAGRPSAEIFDEIVNRCENGS